MDSTTLAREVFHQDHYATQLTGIVIDNVDDHEAICSLAIDARHRNARGAVMGGVLFTLADFCAAVAANSDTLDELHWVSLDSSIHFLSPALGDNLVAHCVALKTGRTTTLFQTQIESPDSSKRIAIVETTMVRV